MRAWLAIVAYTGILPISQAGCENDVAPAADAGPALADATGASGQDAACACAIPAPECLSDTTLITSLGPGWCLGGACRYSTVESECLAGCVDGACACQDGVSWTVTTLEPGGGGRTIALDDRGGVHTTYQNGDIGRYGYGAPDGRWSAVSLSWGQRPNGVVVDPTGAVHVASFYDWDYAPWLFSRPRSSPWVPLEANWSASPMDDSMGVVPTIALDASGGLHVAWRVPLYEMEALVYAYRAPGETAFTVSTVEPDGMRSAPSLVVEPDGQVSIAYTQPGELRLARLGPGGAWTTSLIDEGLFASPVLAVGPDRRLHVVYHHSDEWQSSETDFLYAEQALDGTWDRSVVVSGPGPVPWSLAVDSAGGVHASTGGWSGMFPLVYAHRPPGGAWSFETVAELANDSAIAVDDDGNVHIVYSWSSSYATGWVRYARRRPCP